MGSMVGGWVVCGVGGLVGMRIGSLVVCGLVVWLSIAGLVGRSIDMVISDNGSWVMY